MKVRFRKVIGLLLMATLLCSTVVMTVPQVKAAENVLRSYPETTSQTCVFADGIGSSGATLTDAQVEFIATHFIGNYNTPLALTDRFRAVNNDFISLFMRNAFILSPNEYYLMDGNTRGNDFLSQVDIAGHEAWFYHKGQTIDVSTRTTSNVPMTSSYLMNVTNEDFYTYYKNSLLAQIEAGKFDGVLLDNCAGTALNWDFGYSASDVVTTTNSELNGKTWKQAEEEYLSKLATDLRASGYKGIAGIANQTTQWDTIDYSPMDGVFAGTVFRAGWDFADWKLSMNNLLKQVVADKICFFRSKIGYNANKSTDNALDRIYILANYLLARGKYTYLSYYNKAAVDTNSYYPEFKLDVGTPLNSAGDSIDNLLDTSGLYIRKFSKALVVVNPQSISMTYNIPKDFQYQKVNVSGTGAIGVDGNINGEVSLEDISGVAQIPACGALILIKGAANDTPVLSVTGVASTKIKLSWTEIPGATSYDLYYGTSSGSRANVVTGINGTQYTLSGLKNGTEYFLSLQANTSEGLSKFSNEISATPQILMPTSPQISYIVPGNGFAVVKWTPVEDAKSYELYWGKTSGQLEGFRANKLKLAGNVTRIRVDRLTNGATYYFAVKAINTVGSSALSQEGTVIPKVPIIRNYPETTNKTRVFLDQITTTLDPKNITDAQLNFIANNYVGSQKLSKSLTDRIRAINENFLVLHYRLGVWQSAPSVRYIIDGENWGNDFPVVDQHEDWFMHKGGIPGGKLNRLSAFDDAKLLMNITNPDFYNYFIDTSVLQAQAGEYDGIFYDSFSSDTLNWFLKNIPDSGFGGTAAKDSKYQELGGISWTEAESRYLAKLNADLNVYGISCLPNIGTLFTEWDNTDYSLGDGGMTEGALGIFGGYNEYDWHLSLNNISKLAAMDKILLCETYVDNTNVDERIFTLANYLLIRGKYTYINMIDESIPLQYLPEYDLDMGAPLTSAVKGIDDLKTEGLYIRKFEKGLVVCNPSATETVTYTIPKGKFYKQLSVSGTGNVDANGKTDGAMAFKNVNGVVNLAPHTAAILMNADMPYEITGTTTVNKGLIASVTVTPRDNAPESAKIVYKLMKCNKTLAIHVKGVENISEPYTEEIKFYGYSGKDYKLIVYVVDEYNVSNDEADNNLAKPVTLQFNEPKGHW